MTNVRNLVGATVVVDVMRKRPSQIVSALSLPAVPRKDVIQRTGTVKAVSDEENQGTIASFFRLYLEEDQGSFLHFEYSGADGKDTYLRSIRLEGSSR